MNKSILRGYPQLRMLFYLISCGLFLIISFKVNAQNSDFTENLLIAQQRIYHLKLKEAEQLIRIELKNHPDHVSSYYLQELSAFLQAFISETSGDIDECERKRILAAKQIERLPENDIYRDFFLSELSLHKGLLHLKSANYSTAALAFKEAYQKAASATTKHPDFLPAYKSMALLESVASNLSPGFQWVIRLAGVKTDYAKSLGKTLDFIQQAQSGEKEWMRRETAWMTGYIYWHIDRKESAWQMIQNHTSDYGSNPLSRYFLSVFAHKKSLNEYCLKLLNGYAPAKDEVKIPFLYYLKGISQLQKLDSNCIQTFENFRSMHKGIHYVKSSYLRSAWAHVIFGNPRTYLTLIVKVKSSGNNVTEEDKQAMTEASRNVIPNAILLKSRLLFDGGYIKQALAIIRPVKASDFKTTLEKTEYCYRKGRIYQALKQYKLAIAFYDAAISTGAALNTYYASYACLFLAEIYEKQGDLNSARMYYKKATGFENNSEYVQSIEHKAAAGLRRLK